MPYIDPKVVLEAKKMNLLTILKNFEPHELVRLDKNNYTTRTHDSLKISNGKWMWFSRGIGGTTALNYLIEVKGYSWKRIGINRRNRFIWLRGSSSFLLDRFHRGTGGRRLF